MIVPILLGVAGLGILYAVSHESVDTGSLGGAGSSDGESDGSSAEGACADYTGMTMKQAQKALNMLLYTDKNGNPLAEDGQYGEDTGSRSVQKATIIRATTALLQGHGRRAHCHARRRLGQGQRPPPPERVGCRRRPSRSRVGQNRSRTIQCLQQLQQP